MSAELSSIPINVHFSLMNLLVKHMNTSFGNPEGDPNKINWTRIAKQCSNIPDEVGELFIALGAHEDSVHMLVERFKNGLKSAMTDRTPNLNGVRDALCDINVFSLGAHHLMGIDADKDMTSVITGVMTRFVKDDADKAATIEKHAAKGVTDVYFEGAYPVMIMKSASDQPDAPKGKFMKSASYTEPVFYNPVQYRLERL